MERALKNNNFRIIFTALIIVVNLFTSKLHAQTDTITAKSFTDMEFKEVKERYAKMLKSPTYLQSRKVSNDFISKLEGANNPLFDDVMFIGWLKANIKETKFKDIQEALKMWNHYKELANQLYKENQTLYNDLLKGSPVQLREIFSYAARYIKDHQRSGK